MIRRIIVFAVLLGSARAQISCFAHTTFDFAHNGGLSSVSINTVGASILIAAGMVWSTSPTAPAMLDYDNGTQTTNLWEYPSFYAQTTRAGAYITFAHMAVGGGALHTSSIHTFQFAAGTSVFGSMVIYACNGTTPFYPLASQNGLSPTTAATFATGSVTPVETGDLIVTALGAGNNNVSNAVSINSGFSTPVQTQNFMGAASFLVTTSSSAVNPTWTTVGGSSGMGCDGLATGVQECSTTIVVFKAAGATPPNMGGTQVATLAGTGSIGFSGDGGPPVQAVFNNPGGVTFDSSGNYYLVDLTNNIIRAVNTQSTPQTLLGTIVQPGTIKTVVGIQSTTPAFSGDNGPALNAQLAHPIVDAMDAHNNLYFADQQNQRIRKVSSNGTITTVAGSGASTNQTCENGGFSGDGGPATSALLECPQALMIDPAGNLIIADTLNNAVRIVNQQTTTQVFFGVSTCPGCIETIAGHGIGPSINQPLGLTEDTGGNLYFADWGNCVVRKLTPGGTFTVFAGTSGTCGFSGDGGLATSAKLNGPFDVKFFGGNIYILDTFNDVIREVIGGNISTVFANFNAIGQGVQCTAFGATGGVGGGFIGDNGPASQTQTQYPVALTFDSLGNYYISEFSNQRFRKVTTTVAPAGKPLPISIIASIKPLAPGAEARLRKRVGSELPKWRDLARKLSTISSSNQPAVCGRIPRDDRRAIGSDLPW